VGIEKLFNLFIVMGKAKLFAPAASVVYTYRSDWQDSSICLV